MIMNEEYTCTFEEKESIIYSGLLVYLTSQLGEYLTEQQIELMAQVLKKFRTRPADVEFNDSYCKVITNDPDVRNMMIPRKKLRKDEGAILFYNVSPYALLTRNQTARLAKKLMPRFFATEKTINSSFTRYVNISESSIARQSGITIENLPHHTTSHVEKVFFELGMNNLNNKKHGRKTTRV